MSLLRIPSTSLERARWLCLVASLANVLGLAVVCLVVSGLSWTSLVEELSLAGIWLWLYRGYKRHSFSATTTAAAALCLLVCARLYPDSSMLLGLVFLSICFTSLQETLPAIALPAALLSVSFALGACLASRSLAEWTLMVRPLAAVPIAASVFAALGAALQRFERAVAAEQALTDASAALVAAIDRQALHEAVVKGGLLLLGDSGGRVSLWLGRGDRYVLAGEAGEGSAAPLGTEIDLRKAPVGLEAHAIADRAVVVPAPDRDAVAAALSLPAKHAPLRIFPLLSKGERLGALVVAAATPVNEEVTRSVQSFARQVALALESAALLERVRGSEARFRSIVQNASDIIIVVDADARVQYASPSIEHLTGVTDREAVDRPLGDLLPGNEGEAVLRMLSRITHGGLDTLKGELCLGSPAVESRHVEVQLKNLLADPFVKGVVLVAHDISERKALELRLEHEAFHDPLTGLANRALFLNRVRHALARAARSTSSLAVLFIDLDNFKTINDSFGHATGDQALLAASERLRSCLRETDTPARIGGDELAVLLEAAGGLEDVTAVAARILAAFRAPLNLQGRDVTMSASIGIAMSAAGEEDVEELMASADLAMYEAKHRGKNSYVMADPAARTKVLERLELQADLGNAMRKGELALAYRPNVALGDGGLVGVEALLKWNHPRWRAVLPSEIVVAAEAAGLSHALGKWFLAEACAQVARWSIDFPERPLLLMAKVSTKQVRAAGFVEQVASILAETGLDPRRLILELTGSGATRDAEDLVPYLTALKRLGVQLGIDGFSTGRSSLAVLPRLPVDLLRIDKAFVDGVGTAGGGSMALAVIMLAQIFHLEVIAEGIERTEQATALFSLGCGLGQGRYFSSPLDAADILPLLREPSLPRNDTTLESRSSFSITA